MRRNRPYRSAPVYELRPALRRSRCRRDDTQIESQIPFGRLHEVPSVANFVVRSHTRTLIQLPKQTKCRLALLLLFVLLRNPPSFRSGHLFPLIVVVLPAFTRAIDCVNPPAKNQLSTILAVPWLEFVYSGFHRQGTQCSDRE